jgi:diadenosine tetraphosphate (Ap4A) HIT family hydrolase
MDVLSWNKFLEQSLLETTYPPSEIKLYNRLVAHSDNFFIIAAIGAFIPGYLMLVSKKLIPSLALIEDDQVDELKWLIQQCSDALSKTYNKNVAIFEHGMCACIGGLDRAHLHIMPVSKVADEKIIKESINKVLKKRKSGISSVEVDGYKFTNIHDINEIINGSKKDTYKISGKQLQFEDIQSNLDINNWPLSPRPLVTKGGHYVYFKNSTKASFLSDNNFQTQLGREIIFEIEKVATPTVKLMSEKILKKNEYANIWKWQEFAFKENIYKTMKDIASELEKITSNDFNFVNFSKRN